MFRGGSQGQDNSISSLVPNHRASCGPFEAVSPIVHISEIQIYLLSFMENSGIFSISEVGGFDFPLLCFARLRLV